METNNAEKAINKMKSLVLDMENTQTENNTNSSVNARIKALKEKRRNLGKPESEKYPDKYIDIKEYMIQVLGNDFCNDSDKINDFTKFLLENVDGEEN